MNGPRYPAFDTLTLHAGDAAPAADAVVLLERRVAALEAGVAAIATASGQAALHLAVTTVAAAGDHVVAAATLRRASRELLAYGLARCGIETTFVDARDPDAWRTAIRPHTRVLVGETIGGPGLDVFDVARIGALAHEHDLPLLVDASASTPWLLQPLEHGADLVVHAADAYLGSAGARGGLLVDGGTFDWQRAHERSGRFAALCEPSTRIEGLVYSEESTVGAFALRARREGVCDFGAAIHPHDAHAILHGLETLGLRMERHVASTRKIAAYLAGHAALDAVVYPELDGHPDRVLAARLMPRGCGAVLGLTVRGGAAAATRFTDALRLFGPAPQAGNARSTAEPSADGTLRLRIGLEDADDLIDDLARALKLAQKGS